MDTEQDDSVYITHFNHTVELRCIFKNSRDEIVLTPAEAYDIARDLLIHAAIAEQWKGES